MQGQGINQGDCVDQSVVQAVFSSVNTYVPDMHGTGQLNAAWLLKYRIMGNLLSWATDKTVELILNAHFLKFKELKR